MDRLDIRKERVKALLKKYTTGNISPGEEQELFSLINTDEDEEIIREHIEDLITEPEIEQGVHEVNWQLLYKKIEERKEAFTSESKVRKMFPVRWVAAAVVLLLGSGYYFLMSQRQINSTETVKEEFSKAINVAPPSTAAAVLTLANGEVVKLDSAGNGTVVQQGAVDVVKLDDGQIAYLGSGQNAGYNTLRNPRGSRVINLTLADGTRIWLNAASTIKYPVTFVGKERKIELNGEAYFEVAHNAARPFIVSKGGTMVKVLGTHFNLNAYDDESSLDVTLLEGSVSVASEKNINHTKVIRPGEQAQVRRDGNIKLVASVNLNEVMAWKENLFSFNGADIETIMRQVSRWYNVEIVFKKPVKEKFYAEVSKNTNVSTMLKMLEATKAVHFEMERDVILVTP